jgi:SAM-dependent methyltransferase
MAMPIPALRQAPDRAAALAQYRQRADVYDYELAFFEPIREEAVACLQLAEGATVLDVGCGTGLSFGLLQDRVGRRGRIVGIEQSPEMMAKARQRVREHGWKNVELVCAPAATARTRARVADAALFHFTHDVLREDRSIANVLAHLKPGARVVASGLQWAPPWAWPANTFVLMAALYSVTSLEGLGHPWDKLVRRLADVQVRSVMGCIFIARGVYSPDLH